MLKNKLYRDSESFAGDNSTLDLESIHAMDLREMDREEMENDINADLAVAEEASQTVVEVQEAVAELAESVEEMNPVEVGKAIGSIEDKLDTIAENVEEVVVDTEALAAGNLVDGVRKELEAISDKLKAAWEAVKKFFRGVWEKIKQMSRSLILWITDGSKKSKALLEKLGKVSELKSDLDYKSVADKIGTKMAVILDADLKPEVVMKALEAAKQINDPSAASKSISAPFEKLVRTSSDYKSSLNLTNNHTVLITRFNGNVIKFIALTDDNTYAGYHSATMLPATNAHYREIIAKEIVEGKYKPAEIMAWLKAVPSISERVKSINDASAKFLTELSSMASKEIDDVKFKQGMFKTIWSNTLGHKSADQYTAEDKVKAVRNMMSATSNGISDAIFGGNALIKEINGIAAIVLSCYKTAE